MDYEERGAANNEGQRRAEVLRRTTDDEVRSRDFTGFQVFRVAGRGPHEAARVRTLRPGGTSGLRRGELLLEFGDALFEFLEAHTGAGEHLRLRVEFLARDEVEFRKALRQHGLHVALDVLGRRVFQQIADARLQIVENVAGLLHVIPLPCTKNVHLQLRTCP